MPGADRKQSSRSGGSALGRADGGGSLDHGDDRALMQAIAAGDRDALGQLYDRHAGVVMGLCVRILGSRSEAEETVADIFVELWQRSDRYDPHRAPPFAYLVNLARSRAIDRLRRRRRQADLLAEVAAAPAEGEGAPSGYGRALHDQQRVLVRKAMDVLEVEERKVVELAFFRGLTHREIAEELAQPIGTVKTRIRRGLMRLRDELRNLEDAL